MDIQKKLERVTPELLSEFLYKRGVKVFRCMLCGGEDVAIPQRTINPCQSNEVIIADATMGDANGHPQAIMNYQYRVICKECGYVHFISALPIKDWLDKREEGEEKAC